MSGSKLKAIGWALLDKDHRPTRWNPHIQQDPPDAHARQAQTLGQTVFPDHAPFNWHEVFIKEQPK